MRIAVLALMATLPLAACVTDDVPSEPHAFVGTWDCGVGVFRFTNTTYTTGSDTYPILSVERDRRNYTLRFANGYIVGLGAVTATGLTWVSGTTGDQLNCRRVN